MQRAAEGFGCLVAPRAERRVAVTKVVGAAENHDDVCVGDHAVHAGDEILVDAGIRRHPLRRNPRAADAVAKYLRPGFLPENVPESVFKAACAAAFRDAVP